MRKKREIIREARQILEYTADYHDIPASLYNMSGAMHALKLALGEGTSIDRITRTVIAKEKKCTLQ